LGQSADCGQRPRRDPTYEAQRRLVLLLRPDREAEYYDELVSVDLSVCVCLSTELVNLRDEDITYSSFRRELKTYWFSCNRGAM